MGGDIQRIISSGIPNITGEFNTLYVAHGTGAFAPGNINIWSTNGASTDNNNITFDASRCSSVYGNSDTVQPPAFALIPQIKY